MGAVVVPYTRVHPSDPVVWPQRVKRRDGTGRERRLSDRSTVQLRQVSVAPITTLGTRTAP